MSINELAGEMKAAASSLVTAAAATENGDLMAAVIGVEDALFRVESLLSRLRQAELHRDVVPPPAVTGDGEEKG